MESKVHIILFAFRCKGWYFIGLDGNHYTDKDGYYADYYFEDFIGLIFQSKDATAGTIENQET